MSFATAIRTCFSKYADFNGRATRSEFWWFYLFVVIVTTIPALIAVAILAGASAANPDAEASGAVAVLGIAFMVLAVLVSLALIIPTYAVGCRRLHDRGVSGWLQLLVLVPCGNIVLLVFWVLPTIPGDNQYGSAAV